MRPDQSPFLPKAPMEDLGPDASLRDKVVRYLDHRFEITERDSTVWLEVKSGFISWMTMSYIMVVNPVILGKAQPGLSQGALMSATAVSSVVGSLLCGLWANMPLGLMPGMGLNAYFVFGICHNFDVSFEQALSCTFFSGLLLFVLAQLKVVGWLVKTILSQYLKNAITVSIGMFQAMIGFQIMGLVVGSSDTLVTLGDISFSNTTLYVSMLGFCLVSVMSCRQVHGALLIGIGQIAICSWMMGICSPPQGVFLMPRFDLAMAIDFSGWHPDSGKLNGMLVGTAVLFFVALFDLAGVQYGLTSLAHLLKDGAVPRSTEIFSSAALSTMVGALLGTSPLIIANESSAGIMEGARTGLSAVVVGLLFAVSAFIAPILTAIPHLATAAPLVLIGAFMMGPIGSINWDKLSEALPCFVCVTVVPFTYSIHTGLLAGILMDCMLSFFNYIGDSRQKTKTGLDTPEEKMDSRTASPTLGKAPLMEIIEGTPRMGRMSSTSSARGTPIMKRYQSPHGSVSHSMPNLDCGDKAEKVEKLLSEIRLANGLPGASTEPRDELLMQALEDYLELS